VQLDLNRCRLHVNIDSIERVGDFDGFNNSRQQLIPFMSVVAELRRICGRRLKGNLKSLSIKTSNSLSKSAESLSHYELGVFSVGRSGGWYLLQQIDGLLNEGDRKRVLVELQHLVQRREGFLAHLDALSVHLQLNVLNPEEVNYRSTEYFAYEIV